jgi:subtilisin family serine protease
MLRPVKGFRQFFMLLVLGLVLAALTLAPPAQTGHDGLRGLAVAPADAAPLVADPGDPGAATGLSVRLLVKLAPEAPSLADTVDFAAHGAHWAGVVAPLHLETIDVPASRAHDLWAELLGHPGVVRVEIDMPRGYTRTPNDQYASPRGPSDPYQWYLQRANFLNAWDITLGSADVTIAVLDSGIARDVPDLTSKIVAPVDVSTPTPSTVWPAWKDIMGHGTEVASVAAAQTDNGEGIAGAGWNVSLMPVHLSDGPSFPIDAEIRGIVYAVDHGADIINISAGSLFPNDAEREAVEYALQQDVVVVAAAGNGGRDGYPADQVQYPAAYPGVIAVGATAGPPLGSDLIADWSSRGSALTVVAPGTNMIGYTANTVMWSLSAGLQGTSFASPLVAGLVGLMKSVDPGLTPAAAKAALIATAFDLGEPGFDETYGWGLIDAARALEAVGGRVTTTTVPSTTTTTSIIRPPTTTTSGPTTTTTLPPTTTTTARPPAPRFADVPAGSPYAPAIERLAAAGVIEGYPDGLFHPGDPATRQQFAKMVLIALGRTPTLGMPTPFVDLQPAYGSLYPTAYIALAYSLGITEGISATPPRFGPYYRISRAQVITMVVRGLDAVAPGVLAAPPPGYLPSFGTFSPAHDAAAARASFNGLLSGLDGMGRSYNVWKQASRGEVAQVLVAAQQLRESRQ